MTTQTLPRHKGKRGYTTRQLIDIQQKFDVRIEAVFGPDNKPTCYYEPRTKFDPQPWTDGFFRYHAWELCAVALNADDE